MGASLGLPIAGACTLDALARGLAEGGGAEPHRLAVIDARRGEAFAALYAPGGERLWGPWVGAPGELCERLRGQVGSVLAAGSGAVRFRDELAKSGAEVPEDGDAVHRVAARHICGVAAAGGEPPSPIYLRAPDAERWRERDTSQRPE